MKDPSTLSVQGKMSEEEKPLVSAIDDTSNKVLPHLINAIERHVNHDEFDAKKDSVDFLQVKNSVMISYLIDLTQLIRLTTSPSDHDGAMDACLHRLNAMKVILDKMRPMEKKMRHQLDKLLAPPATALNLDDTTADPLLFRPNPSSLMSKDNDDSNDYERHQYDDDNDDDDEDLKAAKASASSESPGKRNKTIDGTASSENNSTLYKSPKLVSSQNFTQSERALEKQTRYLQRQKDRMKKSELLQTLRSQYSDRPEADTSTNLGTQREAARRFADRQAEKTRVEEDAMIRLVVTRKEKKEKKRIMRDEISNLNAIADLSNLTAGVSVAFGPHNKKTNDNDSSDGDNDDSMRRGALPRHANGKRKRMTNFGGNNGEGRHKGGHNLEKRRATNSFQKALYGVNSGDKKTKRGKK